MITPRVPLYFDPLDLLNRFVPVPFRRVFPFEGRIIRLESNDAALLTPFPDFELAGSPDAFPDISWKLIRDPAVPGHLQPAIQFTTEAAVAIFMGPACLIAVDSPRGRLVAFIGSGVDEPAYCRDVLPALKQASRTIRRFQGHRSFESKKGPPNREPGPPPAAQRERGAGAG